MVLARLVVGAAGLLSAAVGMGGGPSNADAQVTGTAIVRVHVKRADGSALPETDLIINRDRVGAILIGRSDSSGNYVFVVELQTGRYSVQARRIGFRPATAALQLKDGETVLIDMELQAASPTELAAVRVEGANPNYYVGSAEIAASSRPVRDAYEALQKLRPYMLHDSDRCRNDPVDHVWINGRRVLFMARNTPVLLTRPGVRPTVGSRRRGSGSLAVADVLASVQGDHIAEIRLRNCWDRSLSDVGTNNALFVVLKPGVAYDWRRGSYVVDSSAFRRP